MERRDSGRDDDAVAQRLRALEMEDEAWTREEGRQAVVADADLCDATPGAEAGQPLLCSDAGGGCDGCSQECDECDALTCAICLGSPPPEDLAVIKGCEHTYCVTCILQWATYKEAPLCPQCKTPFNYLYVHRQLDGTITDYAAEENIVRAASMLPDGG